MRSVFTFACLFLIVASVAFAAVEPARIQAEAATTIRASQPETSPAVATLVNQLHQAKLAGDRALMLELEEQLAAVTSSPLNPLSRSWAGNPPEIVIHDNPSPLDSRWLPADVPLSTLPGDEWLPSLAAEKDGTLWAVHARESVILVSRSEDGGATWDIDISIAETGISSPSIAIGDGDTRWLFVAYVVDDRFIAVFRADLDDLWNSDDTLIEENSRGVANPRIVTDSDEYGGWYAYLVYNYRFVDEWELHFHRTLNSGEEWSGFNSIYVYSPYDYYDGLNGHPDIDFGSQRLHVTFDDTVGPAYEQRDVYLRSSETYGATWRSPIRLTSGEDDEYDPALGAVRSHAASPTAVVAYTRFWHSQDMDTWSLYSDDDGTTWSVPGCIACTTVDELGVNLATSQDRGFLHAAYHVEHTIEYTRAPYDAPASWMPAEVVTNIDFASATYVRPGVVADPTMDPGEDACVAWTDLRNVEFTGYDIYFNRMRFPFSDVDNGDLPDNGDLADCALLSLRMDNPIVESATITYTLPQASPLWLSLHDVTGRRVRLLEGGAMRDAGRHQANWDRRDAVGGVVPPGVYFCRLSTAQGSQVVRIVTLR